MFCGQLITREDKSKAAHKGAAKRRSITSAGFFEILEDSSGRLLFLSDVAARFTVSAPQFALFRREGLGFNTLTTAQKISPSISTDTIA